jgi:hypothetical protein
VEYVSEAIYEATGQELHSIVRGIVPGLMMFLVILAATTALGAVAGAAIGALAFGLGAAPGAVAGAELVLEAGIALLNFLGLAFLAGYIGKCLWQAAHVAVDGVRIAWHSVDKYETQRTAIDQAAHRLAFAVGLVFRGVLQGIVAFLLAKGTAAAARRVPELVSKLRASKLGVAFADWVEKNWSRLIKEPKLQPEASRGAGRGIEEAESGTQRTTSAEPEKPPRQSDAKPPARAPAKLAAGFATRARPAEVRTAERLAAQYPEFDGRTFDAPPPPDPGYDWVDDLGRTYDAMGDGTKSQFFKLQQFTNSIDSHLRKGNDFTVIDMTGYTPEQIAAVSKYVDGLPASSQALIRRVGF